jgi:hypothetical protein
MRSYLESGLLVSVSTAKRAIVLLWPDMRISHGTVVGKYNGCVCGSEVEVEVHRQHNKHDGG